jgi:hypothetical protein
MQLLYQLATAPDPVTVFELQETKLLGRLQLESPANLQAKKWY